jgi:hypothetical protein
MWDKDLIRLYEDARRKAQGLPNSPYEARFAELLAQLLKLWQDYRTSLEESVARGEMSADAAKKEWAEFLRQQQSEILGLFGPPQ